MFAKNRQGSLTRLDETLLNTPSILRELGARILAIGGQKATKARNLGGGNGRVGFKKEGGTVSWEKTTEK